MAFAVYMLTGEVEHWWIGMKSIREERHEPITWEVFRRNFISKFFPDNVKYVKEVEFLQLTQRNKFVTECAEKLKHLSPFYTMPLDEEWRCKKLRTPFVGIFV